MQARNTSNTIEPAHLAFLAIYNPSLGPTDESFPQQLVFHYSRNAHEIRAAARKHARVDAAGGDALREEENEKLRQIGLAQGMVDFARSFSQGEPVDSIETEKSRIVLSELDEGWWILASVTLTKLPSLPPSGTSTSTKSRSKPSAKPAAEYSSREVSPPSLLLAQLKQAYSIFCLHHGPSLTDFWSRVGREKFCSTLDRFWTRFSRSWDVLLHGNPAVDALSGLKLASGGELGFGVGEEEWGSGERDVLEGFPRRTEGLVDVVVSRFGEPASEAKDQSVGPESEALPWMGSGREPNAQDGIVFGGIGNLDRHSLRDVSLWMRQIYTNGEHAYGVKDNVHRERRKRRRRNPPEHTPATDVDRQRKDISRNGRQEEDLTSTKVPDAGPSSQETSYDDNAASTTANSKHDDGGSAVPPPIALAAERALDTATDQADRETAANDKEPQDEEAEATTLGIPDTYMKYLTFGLSTLNKPAPKKRPPNSRNVSTATAIHVQAVPSSKAAAVQVEDDEDEPMMTQLQPMPDGESIQSRIDSQKRNENEGYFVVGLPGDLSLPPETDTPEEVGSETEGSRIILRTIQVKLVSQNAEEEDSDDHSTRRPSLARLGSARSATSPGYHRLRVLIYARRPFVYCLLFENRTSSLQCTAFYKTLHSHLVALHKPLCNSTSPAKVTQRIENANPESDTASIASTTRSTATAGARTTPSPIFDLIYDPRLLTIHASVPNIPDPGTPAAEGIEGIFSSPAPPEQTAAWTRVEAINVHSLIVSTLANTKRNEIERTSKTSRGWWVVWMKVPPSAAVETPTFRNPEVGQDENRVAFLVRRATDAPKSGSSAGSMMGMAGGTGSRAMNSMLRNVTFGLAGGSGEEDGTGGVGSGWGPVGDVAGMGFDTRKYVEGLLGLGR